MFLLCYIKYKNINIRERIKALHCCTALKVSSSVSHLHPSSNTLCIHWSLPLQLIHSQLLSLRLLFSHSVHPKLFDSLHLSHWVCISFIHRVCSAHPSRCRTHWSGLCAHAPFIPLERERTNGGDARIRETLNSQCLWVEARGRVWLASWWSPGLAIFKVAAVLLPQCGKLLRLAVKMAKISAVVRA